ncbi:MAG TPA: Thivi_2564 family membrane protein [Legionellaceae bacterium]|nr:Thivi_2564 family membrane protein [Legionellaceae bacterium]
MSGLLNLLLILVIFGVLLGLINQFLPMPAFIKMLLNIVVCVVLLIYVLQYFEVLRVLPTIEVFHSPAPPKS